MILFKNSSENWKDSTIRDVIQQHNVECWSDLLGAVPAGYGLELSWPQLKWDQTISRCFTCNKVGFCERELVRNLCITQAISITTFPSLFTWCCTESEYALLLLSACFCPVAAHPSRSWATSFLSVSSGRMILIRLGQEDKNYTVDGCQLQASPTVCQGLHPIEYCPFKQTFDCWWHETLHSQDLQHVWKTGLIVFLSLWIFCRELVWEGWE